MLRFISIAVIFSLQCFGDTAESRRAMVAKLAEQADAFERNAYRIAAVETLKQTIAEGIETMPNGVRTQVPEKMKEVVSDYGWVALDQRGGSLKEIRRVLTVDGKAWNKQGKSLERLARSVGASTDGERLRMLKEWEQYGLRGVITDISQVILLFARNAAEQYEFVFERSESNPAREPALIYRFQQLDGDQALHVYEGKHVTHGRLRGRIWVRERDYMPMQIGLDSAREIKTSKMVDTAIVAYVESEMGCVIPAHVLHQQWENGFLNVTNEFWYEKYRELFPSRKPATRMSQ